MPQTANTDFSTSIPPRFLFVPVCHNDSLTDAPASSARHNHLPVGRHVDQFDIVAFACLANKIVRCHFAPFFAFCLPTLLRYVFLTISRKNGILVALRYKLSVSKNHVATASADHRSFFILYVTGFGLAFFPGSPHRSIKHCRTCASLAFASPAT